MKDSKIYQLTVAALTKKGDRLLHDTESLYFGELMERFNERLSSLDDIKAFATAIIDVRCSNYKYALDVEHYGDQLEMFGTRLLNAAPQDPYIQLLSSAYNTMQNDNTDFELNVQEGLSSEQIVHILVKLNSLLSKLTAVNLLKQLQPTRFDFETICALAELYDRHRFKKSEIGEIYELIVHAWRLTRNEVYELEKYATKLHMKYFETIHLYKYLIENASCRKLTGPAEIRLLEFFNIEYYYVEDEKKVVNKMLTRINLDKVHPLKRNELMKDTKHLEHLRLYDFSSLDIIEQFHLSKEEKERIFASIPSKISVKKLTIQELKKVESARIKLDTYVNDLFYFDQLLSNGVYTLENPRTLMDAKMPLYYLITHYKNDILKLIDVCTPLEKKKLFSNLHDLEVLQHEGDAEYNQRLVLAYLENQAFYYPSQYTKKLLEIYESDIDGINKSDIRDILKHMVNMGGTPLDERLAKILLSDEDQKLRTLKKSVANAWINISRIEDWIEEYEPYLADPRFQTEITNAFCKVARTAKLKESFALYQDLQKRSFNSNSYAFMKAALEERVMEVYSNQDYSLFQFIIKTLEKTQKESA